METKQLDKAVLAQFTGSENMHRHWASRSVVFTEGVYYVAQEAGAHWLLDEIVLINGVNKNLGNWNQALAAADFQVWKLAVNGSKAVLTCEDGNSNVVYTKQIAFTDFPEPGITLWFTNNTILLPSEY